MLTGQEEVRDKHGDKGGGGSVGDLVGCSEDAGFYSNGK